MSENKPTSVTSSPKDKRDDDRMGGVAASMAMDGSINPGLADPSPSPASPSTKNKPVTTATGLANASQSLEHGLTTGVTPSILKTATNDAKDEAKKDEIKNDGVKNDGGKQEANQEEAPETIADKAVHVATDVASAVKDGAIKAVSTVTSALPTRVKDAALTAADVASTVADATTNAIPDPVKDAATAVKGAATDAASTVKDAIPDVVKDAASTVTSTVKDAIPDVVKGTASKTGKSIDPAQVIDAEGSISVSAVDEGVIKKDVDV